MICKGSNVIATKTEKIIIMYKLGGTIRSGYLQLVAYGNHNMVAPCIIYIVYIMVGRRDFLFPTKVCPTKMQKPSAS